MFVRMFRAVKDSDINICLAVKAVCMFLLCFTIILMKEKKGVRIVLPSITTFSWPGKNILDLQNFIAIQ